MPATTQHRPDALRCGLPTALLDQQWFSRQNRASLFHLARDQVLTADIEASALTDLGHALGELRHSHDAACEGVGLLLTQYSAVAEVRLHLVHSALIELNRREEGGSC